MPVYNKLVRDKIPRIIEQSGKQCKIRILQNDEYKIELTKKLMEEIEEYMQAKNVGTALEELADILEIIHALSKTHGASIEKVEEIRIMKAAERGGLNNKIFLVEVEDGESKIDHDSVRK